MLCWTLARQYASSRVCKLCATPSGADCTSVDKAAAMLRASTP